MVNVITLISRSDLLLYLAIFVNCGSWWRPVGSPSDQSLSVDVISNYLYFKIGFVSVSCDVYDIQLRETDALSSCWSRKHFCTRTHIICLSNLTFLVSFQLRKELEAFDPAFFEEIEDLKYNYQKAVERNVLYERQLKNLSKQFGIDVNIPTDDDWWWLMMVESAGWLVTMTSNRESHLFTDELMPSKQWWQVITSAGSCRVVRSGKGVGCNRITEMMASD